MQRTFHQCAHGEIDVALLTFKTWCVSRSGLELIFKFSRFFFNKGTQKFQENLSTTGDHPCPHQPCCWKPGDRCRRCDLCCCIPPLHQEVLLSECLRKNSCGTLYMDMIVESGIRTTPCSPSGLPIILGPRQQIPFFGPGTICSSKANQTLVKWEALVICFKVGCADPKTHGREQGAKPSDLKVWIQIEGKMEAHASRIFASEDCVCYLHHIEVNKLEPWVPQAHHNPISTKPTPWKNPPVPQWQSSEDVTLQEGPVPLLLLRAPYVEDFNFLVSSQCQQETPGPNQALIMLCTRTKVLFFAWYTYTLQKNAKYWKHILDVSVSIGVAGVASANLSDRVPSRSVSGPSCFDQHRWVRSRHLGWPVVYHHGSSHGDR